jgi:DNA-binding response OmpR family regulator
MLTAKDTVADRVLGLDSGADDYLVKPFAFPELLARVRALLRRPPTLASAVLQLADLTLDTHTHEARRAGRSIDLTAKEYLLLEYLLRHPNQVVSRPMIADHLWSYDTYSESNAVDVYIYNLRRKLDDDHTPKLIHTIRGAGYKLAERTEGAEDGAT